MFGRVLRIGCAALVVAVLSAGGARAQLPVDVPDVPATADRLGDVVRDRVDRTRERSQETLRDVRRDTLDTLLRQNRDILERGPDRSVIVRNQITVLADDRTGLGPLLGQGFGLVRERPLGSLGLSLFVLSAPPGLSTRRALDLARQLDPAGLYDFNHIYTRSGGPALHSAAALQGYATVRHARIGLVDTGVDARHPALAGFRLEREAFHGGAYQPAEHGTAVASLMASVSGALVSADIYGGGPTGGSADALIAALGWMSDSGVAVINVSLVGPPNRLLERVVGTLAARGHIVVAAVGNDGASARPLYPAAYDGVIGVTGVSERGRVLPEAGRGAHVDFAAQGAFDSAAGTGGGHVRVRGTSYAAPVVASLLAGWVDRPDPARAQSAIETLAASAEDAGRRGRDDTYGYGIVGRSTLRTASSRE